MAFDCSCSTTTEAQKDIMNRIEENSKPLGLCFVKFPPLHLTGVNFHTTNIIMHTPWTFTPPKLPETASR